MNRARSPAEVLLHFAGRDTVRHPTAEFTVLDRNTARKVSGCELRGRCSDEDQEHLVKIYLSDNISDQQKERLRVTLEDLLIESDLALVREFDCAVQQI